MRLSRGPRRLAPHLARVLAFGAPLILVMSAVADLAGARGAVVALVAIALLALTACFDERAQDDAWGLPPRSISLLAIATLGAVVFWAFSVGLTLSRMA